MACSVFFQRPVGIRDQFDLFAASVLFEIIQIFPGRLQRLRYTGFPMLLRILRAFLLPFIQRSESFFKSVFIQIRAGFRIAVDRILDSFLPIMIDQNIPDLVPVFRLSGSKAPSHGVLHFVAHCLFLA